MHPTYGRCITIRWVAFWLLCIRFSIKATTANRWGWANFGRRMCYGVHGSCLSARLRVCLANANFIRNFCRSVAHEASIDIFGGRRLHFPPNPSTAYPTVSSGSCIWDFTLAEWIISVFCRQSYTNAWSAQVRNLRAEPECWEKPERTRKLSERKLMRCAGEKISHCFLNNSRKNLLN